MKNLTITNIKILNNGKQEESDLEGDDNCSYLDCYSYIECNIVYNGKKHRINMSKVMKSDLTVPPCPGTIESKLECYIHKFGIESIIVK